MKLKTQISLGLLLLFVLLLITGGAGIFFLLDAGQDTTGMEAIVVISLLLAGTFLLNFPVIVARPIQQIADEIGEIAEGNFERRVLSERHDEFGDIARSVNALAEKIEESSRRRSVKPPMAALHRHLEQMEEQDFGRLSPEQLMLISQIKSDCQRLLHSAGYLPSSNV